MPPPMRIPAGITDRGPNHPLGQWGQLDPTRYFVVFDDFHQFTAAASGVTGWHLDESGTATGAAIVAASAGGVILAKPGGTSTNNFQYQWASNTTVLTPFAMAAGKRTMFATRFKIEDVDQNLFRAGLQVAQDDPWATATTDSFLFRSNAAAPQTLEFIVGATVAAQQTITIGTMLDDTWYTAYAVFDGTRVHVGVYDDTGTRLGGGDAVVSSLPNVNLTIAYGDEAVDTGADDIQIDFVIGAQER